MGVVTMPSPSAFARLVPNMLTGLVRSLLWYLPCCMTVQCSVFSYLVYSRRRYPRGFCFKVMRSVQIGSPVSFRCIMWYTSFPLLQMYVLQRPFSFALKLDIQELCITKSAACYVLQSTPRRQHSLEMGFLCTTVLLAVAL